MPTIYEGFDGTVLEDNMAHILDEGVFGGTVDGPTDWAVSAVAGNRRVSIAPGAGTDAFVRVTTDTATIVDLPTPTTAGQFFLICARRTWSTNKLSFVAVSVSAATQTAVTVNDFGMPVIPVGYPASLQRSPGLVKDQPLAYAFVNNSTTTVTVYDVRRGKDHKPFRLLAPVLGSWTYNDYDNPFTVPVNKAAVLVASQTVNFTEPRRVEIELEHLWRASGNAAGQDWINVLTPGAGTGGYDIHNRQTSHNFGQANTPVSVFRRGVCVLPAGSTAIRIYSSNNSGSSADRQLRYIHLALREI